MQTRLNKLRYRAWRRGFSEADLLLGPFADARLAAMSAEDLDVFEALLEEPCQDLYAWIVGQEPAPERVDLAMLESIRRFGLSERT